MKTDRRKFMKSLLLSPLTLFIPTKDKYDHRDEILTNATFYIDKPGVILRAKSVHNSMFHLNHVIELQTPDEEGK